MYIYMHLGVAHQLSLRQHLSDHLWLTASAAASVSGVRTRVRSAVHQLISPYNPPSEYYSLTFPFKCPCMSGSTWKQIKPAEGTAIAFLPGKMPSEGSIRMFLRGYRIVS